jgi:Sigma-70 region 2
MITTETETTNEARVESSRAGRLEDLYMRHAPAGMRLAYFLTGDRELSGDLVQDAFVKVVGRFGHLRVPTPSTPTYAPGGARWHAERGCLSAHTTEAEAGWFLREALTDQNRIG